MIKVEVQGLDEVHQILQRISQKTTDKQDLMRNIAETMKSAVQQNFQVGGRPAWEQLKYRKGMPLVNTGVLLKSISGVYNNDEAVVGTNEPYAAIHHFGGEAGRNKKVTIPKRPFLQLTEQDKSDILEDVKAYYKDLI